MKRSVVMLALFLSVAAAALAQVQGGTIGGTVQDEQGAVLPGMTLTLQGVDATRETVTGADGSFRFLVKRLSNRWMARAGFSYNNAREHFSSTNGLYDANGNPTRTLTEPLMNGGQFAPESGGSGAGSIFVNAKWQLNVNGLYQAPHGIELSANVFGRQGYPDPLFRQVSLGADQNLQVLVSPQIDSLRFPNLWDTDVRAAKAIKVNTVDLRLIVDLFNVFNANTALVRNDNIASPTFDALAQNLSPRIARVGLTVGF